MASHWFFVYWYRDWKLKRLQSKCSHIDIHRGLWDSGYTWDLCLDCRKTFNSRVHEELREPDYCCMNCGSLDIIDTETKLGKYCQDCKTVEIGSLRQC